MNAMRLLYSLAVRLLRLAAPTYRPAQLLLDGAGIRPPESLSVTVSVPAGIPAHLRQSIALDLAARKVAGVIEPYLHGPAVLETPLPPGLTDLRNTPPSQYTYRLLLVPAQAQETHVHL